MPDRKKVHKWHESSKDILNALVIREENLTLVTLQNGNIPNGHHHGYGLYHKDCRFLNEFVLKINGREPKEILASDDKGYSSITMMTNSESVDCKGRSIDKDTISIRRIREIPEILIERIKIENFNEFEVSLKVTLEFDSDFYDIFTVRGITGEDKGKLVHPAFNGKDLLFSYVGKDEHIRSTRISFSTPPQDIKSGLCTFIVDLSPNESREISLKIKVDDIDKNAPRKEKKVSPEKTLKKIQFSYLNKLEYCSNIQTNNLIFNKIFLRSLLDLRMLHMSSGKYTYHAAGVPWYDALFGRDSIISAIQILPYEHIIARSTLMLLSKFQGRRMDNWTEEEPGKILHELRVGEKSNLNEIPQTPYYGSIDSTPLFLILLSEYIDWTGDIDLYHKLKDNVDAAISWIDRFAMSENGFATYKRRSKMGLDNQGWKDSLNAISHSDGSLARHPVALAEVQGYVYMVKRKFTILFSRIGREDEAARMKREADDMYRKFNELFWMKDKKYYAQAIDDKGVCDVISTNPAQCLWTGIIDKAHSDDLVSRIFEPDMFTGLGIRTLSSKEKRYNPMGYHTGTVWPHDNSIITAGLSKYGYRDEMTTLFSSMYDAAQFYPRYRLPELFGGFNYAEYGIPIKYPVACSPQAWSAGTIPHMLSSSLGFTPDAMDKRLTLNEPYLPPWLETARILNLTIGDSRVDLEFRRVGKSTLVNVIDKKGDVEVNVVY
ncbi:amylo-alpha-1,6-glucosidase [Methanocella sp. CWC-04]|uniref:Amylo-alpha-1,6-glucosidase n=1 Tax=Methanooceanicella nereidis TaxID=2052831 RepID=A0AAP2RB02_9EURY|nr:amylo-alpha-1,6-glucosidase [Methanocella sp. CWC-04]MCD1294063.1 amylo-alpha-1,6-glucosidase [Methanocella sp. CWC-04]